MPETKPHVDRQTSPAQNGSDRVRRAGSVGQRQLWSRQICRDTEAGERRPRLSIVAGEVLLEKRRKALLEPGDDLPPVAKLEIFADRTGLAGLDAILAL